jgi:glycerate-2-kinase
MTFDNATNDIRRWFGEALKAVDPGRAVASRLSARGDRLTIAGHELEAPGRVVVVAIGKAAVPMARTAEERLGDRIFGGIALTKDDHVGGPPLRRIAVREAAHPIPDERGVAAAREILDLVGGLGRDDLVLALISGGGSALFEAPVDGVSLAEIAATTKLLLHAGAPIQDLNAVRIPLSRVKGGGLRAAASEARFATLILSDVLGNDPRIIASGPTVPSNADGETALALLDRYGVRGQTPSNVIDAFERFEPRWFDASADLLEIVADNDIAVRAFAEAAKADGWDARVVWSEREGEARELAKEWVDLLTEAREPVLLGGGEATVTVRGAGNGGRNTEFALAAALELERRGMSDWAVASLATDGQDANTGMAGAIASAETIATARAAGVDPVATLDRNDSLAVFQAAGSLVETGPTGTNVNDIYVAVRMR